VQGSQNGCFVNLHNSLKLQNSQKTQKNTKLQKINKIIFFKLNKNCCKSGSFLMIADPLWSCVKLLCGPLWVLCGHTRLCDPTFSRFSRTPTPTCDRQTDKQTDTEPWLVPSVVVLGLGPWPWGVLEDQFWVLGLEQKSLASTSPPELTPEQQLATICSTSTRRPLPLKTVCPPSSRWGASTSYVDCSVDCCARLWHRLQSRGCSLGVDYCWDRTGHTDVRHSAGNFGVSEVQQCCTGTRVPLKLTDSS